MTSKLFSITRDSHFFKDINLSEINNKGYSPVGTPALIDLGFPTHDVSSGMPILYKAVEDCNEPNFEYQGLAVFSKSNSDMKNYKEHQRIKGTEKVLEGLHMIIVQPLEKR